MIPARRRDIALVFAVASILSALPSAEGAQIAISCGAVGEELQLCRSAAQEWARKNGHSVTVISTPNGADQRLALYQQLFAAQSPDIDVLQVDAIWPGILGRHFVDLKPYVPRTVLATHFASVVDNNMIDGRLVAMPWFVDVGLLYYRKDLLEKYGEPIPETWGQMTEIARRIQDAEHRAGNPRMWGGVFQARSYEGLTCNALEWVYSYGGGGLVEADGRISINNPQTVTALQLTRSWIGTVAPQGVLSYSEEEARGVFQSGNAVFMRNWGYAWSLANAKDSPIAGKVGLGALPASPGEPHAGALGGWQLAISKYSRHPELAADLILYLTSAEEQRRRALEAAFNPTIQSLYDDPEVLAVNPHFAMLREALAQAVPRPSRVTGLSYNRVSSAFWNTVHDILSGEAEIQPALIGLEQRLQRIRGEGW
jgi:trehalose/maltose transport system substrate-binding protein